MSDTSLLLARLAARRATPLPEARAMTLAERVLQLAPELGLDELDDTIQVLDLWLSLAEDAPASLYRQGMLRVVLSIKRWPVAARVAFLRRHLTGREASPADEAMARALFGVGGEAST